MTMKAKGQSHTVVAADVTAGSVDFWFDHMDGPFTAIVQVVTSAGVVKAHDGAIVISGKKVTVDNTGVTDFAATDVIHVIVA